VSGIIIPDVVVVSGAEASIKTLSASGFIFGVAIFYFLFKLILFSFLTQSEIMPMLFLCQYVLRGLKFGQKKIPN
jgi:hypothetical protein